jgi:hypothetical protein
MRVDLYRRREAGDKYSYLLVLGGKPIPEEVIDTGWNIAAEGIDVSDEREVLPEYAIEQPFQQIGAKGYAITSVNYQPSAE